jgi:hypothetical protein
MNGVSMMYDEFEHSNYIYDLCADDRTIIVVSKHGNKFGKATCKENEKFRAPVGIAIAFARAIGQEVPTVLNGVKIDTLCHRDKFIYGDNSFVYVAKHPLLSDTHIVVSEKTEMLRYCRENTLVEKI